MKITRLPSRRRSAGFTLMELLLVLAIIGLLMGGVAVGYNKVMDSARETKAATQIGTITAYIQQYSVKKNGRVPTASEGLRALAVAGLADEGLLEKDPWGNPWEYVVPGKRSNSKFDVFSKGKDEIAGNEDDVGNWETK